jgi:hypothetical protein
MTYRYPWRAMVADYSRAVLGVVCTVTPLILACLPPLAAGVLVVLAILFALFGMQAIYRHTTRILVSEGDIRARPLGQRLAWDSLSKLTLGYFSVRRDGRRGWMELKLRSGRRTLRVDSRLDGFTEVVRQAVAAANDACLHLDPSTLSNLAMLGLGERVVATNAEPRPQEHG